LNHNFNIKGKTLRNPNLNRCNYSPSLGDHTYSLCEPANVICRDYFQSFPQCEENNEPSDYIDDIEPSDIIEPFDDVEPSNDIEPSDDVELFDYDEIF